MEDAKTPEEEPQPIEIEYVEESEPKPHRKSPHSDLIQMRVVDWKTKMEVQKPPRRFKTNPDAYPVFQIPRDDPRRFAGAIALGSIQVIMGIRPIKQLDRWLTYDIYDALAERTKLFAHFRPHIRRLASPMCVKQVHVKAIRNQAEGEFPIEAAATVFDGERVRAVAMRLKPQRGQWKVCALEIG